MHLSQGIIIAMLFLPALELYKVLLVVVFPFLIDFDFLLSKYAKNRNHRRLLTHSFLPYICLLIIGLFIPLFLILSICGLVHVLSDAIDWGTALFSPFYKDTLGGILPTPPKEIVDIPDYRKRQCWFTKTYYNSYLLLGLEISFGFVSTLLIIIVDIWYLWLLIFYFLLVFVQVRFYLNCKENKKI